MPIPLFNSIASWILKKRIHQIELFIKYPHEVQEELLHNLLSKAHQTEIGMRYGFESIKNYDDFKNQIPLSNYESIESQIKRCRQGTQNIFWPTPIKWFAKSSGTTNSKSKFIPVSAEALEDCHYKAGKDMLSLYFNNNEDSQLLTGKCLRLGGSSELYNNNNSYFGDLSAIIIQNLPFWAELSSTPSNKTSLMAEWETKMKAIVEESIPEKVTSLAGIPSWMMVLLQNVLEESGQQTITDIWPNAEVYFHGGVSFKPYRELYNKLFPKNGFQFYEIYNASEGFFGIQDRNNSDELLLMLDYGIFYEFIPFQPNSSDEKIIPLSEVEIGINYALIITTNAGLWRYQIGDTIRFTCLSPYRIKVTGRTKHHINAFGEELIIDNAEKALEKVCASTQSIISNYTAAPIFMKKSTKGAHEWIIEFEKAPVNLDEFSTMLDLAIQNENSDYEAKRYKNMTLQNLQIHKARKNLFYDWLRKKKKLGGQNKVPRLSNSRKLIEELLKMNL
ncbi:GH3 auxin-responsive promoter family protein [Flavobacteriaceae bacterium]|nr:GH3 auxin-responsive promoter family protein [Flavobacteriaceae bacterium]|tara:strand:- start:566 stop:2077 length:1512 start_codon:yes stop_codon:yes gene_type:complete